MIRVKQNNSFIFKPISYNKLLTRKRLHFVVFLCWFSLILLGTSLIGISTNLYEKSFESCQDSQKFCSEQFTLTENKEIFIYLVVQNLYQNNRMFLDSYSPLQLAGNVHNNYHCQNAYTYGQLGLDFNAGGYRAAQSRNAHPCGSVMTSIYNDTVFLITSSGGAPSLDSKELISDYNLQNNFIGLPYYQLSQWINVQSSNFVNHFTIPYTSTKYSLVGRVSLTADTYQLIIKNNYPTKGVLKKKVLITETNQLGIKDPILGFYMFICGNIVLFFHVFLCCKGIKSN